VYSLEDIETPEDPEQPEDPKDPEQPENPDIPDNPGEVEEKYIVVFNSNGGTNIKKQEVKKDNKIVAPSEPIREGYIFEGWYYENQKWDFDNDVVTIEFDEEGNRIYEEFCLYAKWEVEEKTQWEKFLDFLDSITH
jgi:hypothetical protein